MKIGNVNTVTIEELLERVNEYPSGSLYRELTLVELDHTQPLTPEQKLAMAMDDVSTPTSHLWAAETFPAELLPPLMRRVMMTQEFLEALIRNPNLDKTAVESLIYYADVHNCNQDALLWFLTSVQEENLTIDYLTNLYKKITDRFSQFYQTKGRNEQYHALVTPPFLLKIVRQRYDFHELPESWVKEFLDPGGNV